MTINGKGVLLHAEVELLKETPILVSESSAVRAGISPAANPLSDKLAYCAGDGSQYGLSSKYFERFHAQLTEWCASEYRDVKACAVLEYINQNQLISDLIAHRVLTVKDGQLEKIKIDGKAIDPTGAWIRWRVELRDQLFANTWEDPDTFTCWERFESSKSEDVDLCMSSGVVNRVARLHPKSIRSSRDQAKLISSNDLDGYTFRGRFVNAEQSATVSYASSQKAHIALRWLIRRQGYRSYEADQVVVAWAVSGQLIPKVMVGSDELIHVGATQEGVSHQNPRPYRGDAGQLFATQMNSLIRGYAAKLQDREDIVVMALDSATPGRMAITYYRELQASEFLDRILTWHEGTAWPQNMGKDRKFTGAPAPRDIAEAAYGRRVDEKLKKSTVERLLPCIVDGQPIPRDLVTACVQQASNPAGKDRWEWERCLGIACALVRGSRREREYKMALEEDRNSRDYLFGRLLAIAEKIESYALFLAKENRDTTAERLMQRFSDHPAATWRTIELALRPYMQRLQGSRAGALYVWKRLLDDVISRFQGDDFVRPGRLDAEFLLGYHCQRAAFRKDEPDKDEPSAEPTPELQQA